MGLVAGFVVGLDVAAVEPDLASLDAGEGIGEVHVALADGFDLGATEFESRLVGLEDVIVARSFAVGGDLGHARDKKWVLCGARDPFGKGGCGRHAGGDQLWSMFSGVILP